MAFVARNLNPNNISCATNAINAGILKTMSGTILPSRNTFVLRRKNPAPPGRINGNKREWFKLKAIYKEYILVEDTQTKRLADKQFVLKTFVEDVGQKGDIIWMHPLRAYERLVLPGLADFGTPENIAEALKYKKTEEDIKYSTITAPEVKRILEVHTILKVTMNKETPWTMEPWHIRVACRQANIMLGSNDCVQFPRKIEGPNLDWEAKEFYVIIKINNFEEAKLRCRLHHWSTSPFDRLPWESDFWDKRAEPIFPEDAELLSKMPLPPPKRVVKDDWA
nr:PREDICTED: 39S ribosomal protein L9, mitochondrial [Bemisia tabaci]